MKNRDFFETDEYSNFIDSLEILLKFLNSNYPSKIKWAVISLHQALYEIFICALKGTDPRQTIIDKKDDSGKATYLHANGVDINILARTFNKTDSQIREWLGHPKIISFDEAFKRIRNKQYLPSFNNVKPLSLTNEEITRINRLSKEFRNEFEHFAPKVWLIENSLFWPLIETSIGIIKYIVYESNCLIMDKFDEEKISDIIRDLDIIITRNQTKVIKTETPVFAISPIHTTQTFSGPLSIDNKIDIFIARVKGWQIQPAIDLKLEGIRHSDFAKLSIVSSYFEMIGKYYDGFLGKGCSSKFFKRGLQITFPEINTDENDVLNAFYERIRNGLYHIGLTQPNVILTNGIPGSFGYNFETKSLAINPDKFIDDISMKFELYAKFLKDKNNVELRESFERRFNYDNGLSTG